jgi:hypothetical protein
VGYLIGGLLNGWNYTIDGLYIRFGRFYKMVFLKDVKNKVIFVCLLIETEKNNLVSKIFF